MEKSPRDTDLIYSYKGTVWHVGEDGERTELRYKGYDKSTDSLRYGLSPRNITTGFSRGNVKRIGGFSCRWQGEGATNGRGFTKRELGLNASTEG